MLNYLNQLMLSQISLFDINGWYTIARMPKFIIIAIQLLKCNHSRSTNTFEFGQPEIHWIALFNKDNGIFLCIFYTIVQNHNTYKIIYKVKKYHCACVFNIY